LVSLNGCGRALSGSLTDMVGEDGEVIGEVRLPLGEE
jgi:hypothetical protein